MTTSRKSSLAFLALPLAAALLSACSSTATPLATGDSIPVAPTTIPASPDSVPPQTTLPYTTASAPPTNVAPTTAAPVTTAPVTTTKPKTPTSTTKPTTVTTVSGNADEARSGARTMLAKAHENFYRDGDIISLGAGFDSIESRYAAYSAKVGTTLTGYYITLSGFKTCYLANGDDPGMVDTAC